ncbi:PAS domain S-box protein [Oceanicola sp. 22II-s10i]|uniref:ATP-binding response regulator n=1 Tax=Oceanicola sp. 22II-s10i TaxID=1317116 RepID=UPI000B52004A|nr:PAS domain S-box protein [Oceanicola sp. 22II-s10i]
MKQIAEARSSGLLAEALLASALDAVIVMDENGRVVEWNPMAEKLFGYDRSEALERPLSDLVVPPAMRDRHAAGYRRYVETGESRIIGKRIEIEAIRRDGTVLPVEMTITEARLPNRRLFAAHLRDLTERRAAAAAAEEQRRRLEGLEKLSALGTLLGGVAHELNNPLAVILAQSTLLAEKARDPETARRAERIHNASERCARILKSFMAMARQRPTQRARTDAAEILRDALDLTAYGRRSVGIETLAPAPVGPLPVDVDHDLVAQSLAHVLVFLQARIGAGQGLRQIRAETHLRDGFAMIELADTGPALSPDLLSRLFEAFAPVDPAGAGTGIGLHIARETAEAHGGRLICDGSGGVTFRMFLPLATEAEALAAPAAGLRVLVVDDEPDVGASLADILTALGHSPLLAIGAREGIARFEAQAFDVVMADYRMPELDGLTLLRRAITARPALAGRCVLATGDPDRTGADLDAAGIRLLVKPFSVSDVRDCLARLQG